MDNGLTTIAAIPGSGAGCVAALHAERYEGLPVEVTMAAFFQTCDWPDVPIVVLSELRTV